MKRIVLFAIVLLSQLTMLAQAPAPCGSSGTATKWPVVNNGLWTSGATWNGGTVPGHNAVVVIPSGMTVRIKNTVYTAATTCPSDPVASPTMKIYVCGVMSFEPSAKMNLGCLSTVYIGPGAFLGSSNNNQSYKLQIGPAIQWGGPGPLQQDTIRGPYGIQQGSQGPLPMTLDGFKADNKVAGKVTLSWVTFQEINSLEFGVERSTDLNNWEVIGSVKAAGTSGSILNYSFVDMNALSAPNVFYRLKQLDADGKYGYSGIVRVSTRSKGRISLYPNPVVSVANIHVSEGLNINQSVQLFDFSGRIVRTIAVKSGNLIQINTDGLKAGSYFIRLIENGKTIEQVNFMKH